jgi:hypothetical protein
MKFKDYVETGMAPRQYGDAADKSFYHFGDNRVCVFVQLISLVVGG